MSVKLKQSLSSLASFFRRSNRSEDEHIQQELPIPPTNTEGVPSSKDRLITALPKYRKSIPYEWIQASTVAGHPQTAPTLEDHLRDLSVRTSESSSSTTTTATATLWRDSSDLDHSMFPDFDRRPTSKHHQQPVVAIVYPPPATSTMDIKQLLPASETESPPSRNLSCECDERRMMTMMHPHHVPLPIPLPPKPPKKKKKSVLRTTSLGSFASSNDTLFHSSSKRVRFQASRTSLRSVTSTTLRRVRKSVLRLKDQFWKPHENEERTNNNHNDDDEDEDDVNPLKGSKFNKTQQPSVNEHHGAELMRSSTVRIAKTKGEKEYGYDMAVRRARMGSALHGMV
ncbi:hypothetical protein BC832DRAFT_542599 [Gaertneriomyces semiglobifer]|nr:hypothetical protein BC832DRAFT_542599 [Gaertneriomyces semiglobifer]